jgi:multiple antibiotic resistance protein
MNNLYLVPPQVYYNINKNDGDHMLLEFLTSTGITLLVTLDPPGMAPIFLSLTMGMNADERKRVATRASLIAFCIMVFFAIGGDVLLRALGISLPAFRIAGGILLFSIAFEMVFELRSKRKTTTARIAITEDHIHNVAAFPLAIPLMAGPGTITAVILLAGRSGGQLPLILILAAMIALVVLTCLIMFLMAERVSRWLGITGNVVLTRLLGVILSALAIQFVIDGVKQIVAGG